MPELPEVEVIMRGVSPSIIGKKIKKIEVSIFSLRVPIPKKSLESLIQGAVVQEVARRAKYMTVLMNNGSMLVLHLGMTGNLGVFPAKTSPKKHDHVRFLLSDGMELRLNDTRRFGAVYVFGKDDPEKTDFFAKLGPEPFSAQFSAIYLALKAKGRKQPVKNFLMNNHIAVGIGNIYASEILFAAKIAPDRPVGLMSGSEWEKIVTSTRTILAKAIKAGGSTISDYVNSRGEKGYFQLSLQVYGRKGQKCKGCGNLISKEVMAGRATFYCRTCQK